MEAYTDFATVYDRFMEEVPYAQWLAFLEQLWQKEATLIQTIADLGCGTGNMLLPLAKKGYTMMGVDLSFDMLSQAEQKLRSENLSAVLLEQDLTEFALPMQADCILSVCDSLNYLIEDGELSDAFACVAEYLKADGLFCFDMNTEYHFRERLGENTFAATDETAAYIWENFYDEAEKINEYAVTFFCEDADGRYTRSEEVHYERAYSLQEITDALKANGLCIQAMYADYTEEQPQEDTTRILFVAKHQNGGQTI